MELIEKHMPRGGFTLAPIGDIQYGSQGCAEDMLRAHIAKVLADDAWLVGMGDYLDHMSPSNRRALMHANVDNYESARSLIDDAVHGRVRDLASSCLADTKGRWLGLVLGDHIWTYEDGQTCDEHLANMMGAPCLGHSAIVSVVQKGVDRPLRIYVAHGAGSSVSATGKTLHLERLLGSFDVDIVLMGHSHLLYGFKAERIKKVSTKAGPDLYAEQRVGAITGSFLKGYEKRSSVQSRPAGSYVEQKALRPVALGGLTIRCEPVRYEWGWEWDLEVRS